jgi:hypothetical protein
MFTRQEVMTLGLFEKRIEGDDCLMELARRRFREAGMGGEMHSATPEALDSLMKFRPSEDTPIVLHLPRDIDLKDARSRSRIADFSTRFAGRVYGMVLHDHAAMAGQAEHYVEAAWDMESVLGKIRGCPVLFIEYAAGLDPGDFARFFARIRDLDWVSACIDIGHVGIRQARAAYARSQGGEDICALKSRPLRLRQVMADVENAVRSGADAVMDLIDAIGELKKPVHFHLHDGHPLSDISPFGVSDHLGFLATIPLGFEYQNRRAVAPMFGPEGLAKVVSRAFKAVGPRGLSFTLEIHPTGERLALEGDATPLFAHWTDKTNAERMNHWLWVLVQNHCLLQQATKQTMQLESRAGSPQKVIEATQRSADSGQASQSPANKPAPPSTPEGAMQTPKKTTLPAKSGKPATARTSQPPLSPGVGRSGTQAEDSGNSP